MAGGNLQEDGALPHRDHASAMAYAHGSAGKLREQFSNKAFNLALGHRLVSLVFQSGDDAAIFLATHDAGKLDESAAPIRRTSVGHEWRLRDENFNFGVVHA